MNRKPQKLKRMEWLALQVLVGVLSALIAGGLLRLLFR